MKPRFQLCSAVAALLVLSSCGFKLKLPHISHKASSSKAPAHSSGQRQDVLHALRTRKEASFQVHVMNITDEWAFADVTPLDKGGRPIAEGGPHVLQLLDGKWKELDLSKVPPDPKDPLGMENSSPGWIKNVQKTYPGVPRDIFPKASH